MIKGDTATLKATVAPAGTTQSKTVTWSSSNTSVATVDSDGAVSAVEGGSAKITAKSVNGKTADCFVTVTVPATGIEIHATPFEIDRGDSRTLTATVLPTDATDKSVSWATSDSSIVAVDENGKITAEAPGAATITAATADGKYFASCAVNVIISISSLNLNKTTDTIIKGATDTLTATIDPPDTTEDKTVTWTSTDPAVATVDSDGVVTAVEGGTTTITAQAGSHFAECVVTVIVPVTGISIFPDASIEKGTQQRLMVTFTPSDATDRAVTWSSSNPAVATVDEDGKIMAVSVGSTAITATSHDGGFTATCNVSVVIHVTGVTLDQTSLTLIKGAMQTLTAIVQPAEATDKTLLWSSSNPDVATVDSTGAVTAVEGGAAVITAKSKDGGKTAQCTVTVKVPVTGVSVTPSLTIEKGTQQGLTATITPADATDKAVAWSSSDPDIASVDAGGNITAVSVGHVTVTATSHDGGFTASCDVSVVIHVTGVSLDKTTVLISKNQTVTLSATMLPADATNKAVSWSSSNTGVATVDASGVVTAVGGGTGTITVKTADGGYTASCTVTVTVPVTGVSLDKITDVILPGDNDQLNATITPSDASDKALIWSSSDTSVATVDQSGVVTAVSSGQATITVTTHNKGFTSSCVVNTLTVTASLVSYWDGTDAWGGSLITSDGVVNLSNSKNSTSGDGYPEYYGVDLHLSSSVMLKNDGTTAVSFVAKMISDTSSTGFTTLEAGYSRRYDLHTDPINQYTQSSDALPTDNKYLSLSSSYPSYPVYCTFKYNATSSPQLNDLYIFYTTGSGGRNGVSLQISNITLLTADGKTINLCDLIQ